MTWHRCWTRCPSRSCTACSPCRTPRCRARSTRSIPKGDQWYWRADFVQEIPDAAVDLHVRFGSELPTLKSTMHLYPIDGAAHDLGARRTPRGATATPPGPRSTPASIPTRPTPTRIRDWTVAYQEALHPYSAGGAYVNMMMEEGPDRVRASYRGNYDRLAAREGGLRPRQRLPHQPEHRAGGEPMMRALLAVLAVLAVTAPAAGAQTPQCAVLGTPCKLSVGLDDAQFMNPHPAPNGQRVVFAHGTLERPGGALHRPDPRRPPRAAQPSRART